MRFIVSDLSDSPVEIDLSNLSVGDNIKKTIRDEFKYIKDLLDFDSKSQRYSVIGILMVDYTIIR